MKKTVLFVLSDLPLLPGKIGTGQGARIQGIARGLESKGYKIIYTITEKKIFEKDVPRELKANTHTHGNLRRLVEKINPDIIFKESWGPEVKQLEGTSIPIVFDLPAPRLLEEAYHNRSLENMLMDKLRSFHTGDYFICSAHQHKIYYLPYLIMSGVDTRQDVIGVVPHSKDVEPCIDSKRELLFISAGVCWPWQNPIRTFNIVIELLEKYQKGYLNIYSGAFPYNSRNGNDEQRYFDPIPHLIQSERVKISDLIPHDEIKKRFCMASVALEVMEENLERDLSLSHRTLDYLSCGLPVIIGKNSEWSRWIRDYQAGWVVDPSDSIEIRETLKIILHEPEKITEYSKNAIRLIRDNFSCEKTIEPLYNFCKNPIKRKKEQPILNNLLSMEMGRKMREEGFFQGAVKSFRECINEEKTPERIHLEIGTTFIEQGNLDLAEAETLMEDKLYPGRVETKLNMGIIYRRRKKFQNALTIFNEAIEVNPLTEWIHLERGMTYGEMGRYKKALRDLEEEERLCPDKAETKLYLGIIFKMQNRNGDALTVFQEAVNRNPSLLPAQYNLYAAFESMGKFKKAKNGFFTLLSDTSSSKTFRGGCCFHIGKISLHEDNIQDAEKYLNRCLEFIPEHGEALRCLDRITPD